MWLRNMVQSLFLFCHQGELEETKKHIQDSEYRLTQVLKVLEKAALVEFWEGQATNSTQPLSAVVHFVLVL